MDELLLANAISNSIMLSGTLPVWQLMLFLTSERPPSRPSPVFCVYEGVGAFVIECHTCILFSPLFFHKVLGIFGIFV